MKNAASQTQPIPLLDCAAGLVELSAKKYKDAAKHFLKCQFDNCDFPEVWLIYPLLYLQNFQAKHAYYRYTYYRYALFTAEYVLDVTYIIHVSFFKSGEELRLMESFAIRLKLHYWSKVSLS